MSNWSMLYLVPAVGPVWRVDQQSEDLGFGQEGGGSFGCVLRGKVVCTFLKQEVCTDIRRYGKKLHIPLRGKQLKVRKKRSREDNNRLSSHPPVDAFVVIVGVEKLNLLECFRTGEVTGDEGMHDKEEVECCRAWKREKENEKNPQALPLLMMKLYVQLIAFKRNTLSREIRPTDRETKRHGIDTPFTL